LAKHLLLDLRGCNKEVLDNLELLKGVLQSIAQDSCLLVESFHQFSPQGISGIIWTNGFRLYIHTWPEYNYAAVDILTYNEDVKLRTLAQTLIQRLGTKQSFVRMVKRGF
jgi:S-adenosylmethionine decarboxylase proenzyme